MKIGVIMGGISSEYEVSMNTGKEILANLDDKSHALYPIVIKDKKELFEKVHGLDFAVIALHGQFGEDGGIQGTLDTMGIPYTGSGLAASALCMNKDISKKLLRYEGVHTPDWIMVQNTHQIDYRQIEQLGYPVVVKPNAGGSSVGTTIVHKAEEVYSAVQEVLKLDRDVMIEQFIKGEEITCSLLKGDLLPILSIKPKAAFFDYSSKYDDGGAEETVIELEETLYKQVENAARKCYHALKCSVYARVDMIIKDDLPYVLEINTLPGMTKNSLFPKSARAAGIPFDRLLKLLIEYSQEARSITEML